MPLVKKTADGLIFKVYIQPNASKNMISGRHADALKLKLTAPPVEGAANKLLIQFLAKHLKIPKSTIDILSGHTSRSKVIEIRFPGTNDPQKDRIAAELESLFF